MSAGRGRSPQKATDAIEDLKGGLVGERDHSATMAREEAMVAECNSQEVDVAYGDAFMHVSVCNSVVTPRP